MFSNIVPQPPNQAWGAVQDINDEEALELEEMQLDEEMKQIYQQDLGNQFIMGFEQKDDEEEEEEEEEEMDDMEEYTDDTMQIQDL